jgi:hypothetical protein
MTLEACSESGPVTRQHVTPQVTIKAGRHWIAENRPNLLP